MKTVINDSSPPGLKVAQEQLKKDALDYLKGRCNDHT